ncbi:RNA 2',3'-cyclic phosphodiesterase [Peribacillus asahii]|uniref:RNA 2',3'-cyclic phosphodiesterase n=1 Tax=Peribacillus asahii TaxID=228899 RepID=UPI00380092BB
MANTHFFFALTLPDELKKELYGRIEQLKTAFPFKKWLHPADYHITMAFLGHASESMRNEAAARVKRTLEKEAAFPLILDEIGTFGRDDYPRILWAGVEFEQRLFDVQKKVYQACLETGFSLDPKPFKPHITLARKYNGEEAFSLQQASSLTGLESKSFLASAITLYQTHIGASPSYEPICSIQLQ